MGENIQEIYSLRAEQLFVVYDDILERIVKPTLQKLLFDFLAQLFFLAP